jgi:hypothetical protein
MTDSHLVDGSLIVSPGFGRPLLAGALDSPGAGQEAPLARCASATFRRRLRAGKATVAPGRWTRRRRQSATVVRGQIAPESRWLEATQIDRFRSNEP